VAAPTILPKRRPNVTVEPGTNILDDSFSSPRPEQAQRGARAFALAYIAYKRISATNYLNEIRAPLLARQTTLNNQYRVLNTRMLAGLSSVPPAPAQLIASEQQTLNGYQDELRGIEADLQGTSPAKLNPPTLTLDATLPTSPSSPNKPLIVAVGLFIGLAFGIGVALIQERLDNRLRGRRDLEEAIGVPVLAVIPHVPGWKKRDDPQLISVTAPKSAAAEAYRTLRTAVLFLAAQRGLKSLMVVSPTAGEGKSTTAANLAVSLADAGKRVVLLSADLRKPRLHQFFHEENQEGLSNVLADGVKPWDVLQDPKVKNLRVVESGPTPANPSELLQSEQMGELLTELSAVADFLILDTAPVLLVADPMGLAPLVDGVLFVADAEMTSTNAVSHARQQLEQVGAPLIGAVLNNFDPQRARAYASYGYGYRYRYSGYDYQYGYTDGYALDNGEGRRGQRGQRESRRSRSSGGLEEMEERRS